MNPRARYTLERDPDPFDDFDSPPSPTPFMNRTLITVTSLGLTGALAFILWGWPQLNIYNRTMAGRAALMEAESTRQTRVLDARAKQEAAALEAQAEIVKAQGSAQAIAALKQELGSSDAYLRWLYIQGLQEQNDQGDKTVVYIPTDGLVPLPISEATRQK